MYDELVKELRYCSKQFYADYDDCDGCHSCRYDCYSSVNEKMEKAADAIEKLMAENKRLLEELNNAHNEGYDVGYYAGRRDYEPEWISVEERVPEKAGEYIVAYHPCYWNDVKAQVTKVGIDTFRGKTSWAKQKFQRVTYWMPLLNTEGLK